VRSCSSISTKPCKISLAEKRECNELSDPLPGEEVREREASRLLCRSSPAASCKQLPPLPEPDDPLLANEPSAWETSSRLIWLNGRDAAVLIGRVGLEVPVFVHTPARVVIVADGLEEPTLSVWEEGGGDDDEADEVCLL